MDKAAKHFYEFGPFRIEAGKRRLTRNGDIVPLTPKAFDTLLVLVEQCGRVVEKDELMEKVWPGVAVEENNLTQNISAIRKALGEKRDEPEYILTAPGQGYRFIGTVNEFWDDGAGAVETENHKPRIPSLNDRTIFGDGQDTRPAEPGAKVITEHSKTTLTSNRKVLVALALIIVLGFVVLTWRFSKKPTADVAGTPIRSIAVLPFRPLASEKTDEYLGMGMADALITRLSNIKQIVVRPTSSVSKFANSSEDLAAIGRKLEVDSLLEGRVQKSDDRIRVTVQLIRVKDGAPLWAGKFDEKYTDVFSVEDRISEQVAASLLPTLTGTQKEQLTRHYTEDTDAYQSYIMGRYYWNKRNAEAITKSVSYFQDAILKDPNYALAYAGLADAYATLRLFDSRPEDVMPKARSAALKALELDDNLAEAHASLAYVKHRYDWDWPGAEKEFKRAIELNPNYATAHQWYGWYLATLGSFDQATEEFKRAQELEPMSLYVNLTIGVPPFYTRQYDKAVKQFQKVIELDPKFPLAHRWLAKTYQQQGRYEEAIAEFQRYVALSGEPIEDVPAMGNIYAATGKPEAAHELLNKLKQSSQRRYVSQFHVAIVYAGLNEKDQVFEWLEKGYRDRDPEMVMLKIEPQLDGLHSDSRFVDLLRRVGLPQ
jgi:DNA-binding winged helix-turn-helix (wHTH) protein/TolB-like protein/lipoprotein NlpI